MKFLIFKDKKMVHLEQGSQTQKDSRAAWNFFFEICVKNKFIWQNNSLFPLKSSLFLMFAGRMWPAGRETPDLEITIPTD